MFLLTNYHIEKSSSRYHTSNIKYTYANFFCYYNAGISSYYMLIYAIAERQMARSHSWGFNRIKI